MASHYQRLGVRPSASTEEIRAAYRALAQRLHPDRQGDATTAERALAERRMREINQAWAVLSDPARRRAYDLDREAATRGGRRGREAAGPARGRGSAGRSVVAAGGTPPRDDDEWIDVAPDLHGWRGLVARHLPWVAILVVLGVIFVATAYAGGGRGGGSGTAPGPTAVAEGSCVDVDPGPVTTPVDCAGPHDLRIVARVAATEDCPVGTEPRRLAADGLVDCVTAA
jgi:hypothetical protein